MFTGIVTACGNLAEVTPTGDGMRVQVKVPAGFLQGVKIGDSIAVNGACLTVTSITDTSESAFEASLSAQTLAVCAPWQQGMTVHLEHALAVGDRIGGHFVSGHVEGTASVSRAEATADGGRCLTFTPPPELMRFIITKGSIAVAGVSLTVNAVTDTDFSVQIVPHTLTMTTFGEIAPGDRVNLETDMLARHLAKFARQTASA